MTSLNRLFKDIEKAIKREVADKHLSFRERWDIVKQFKKQYPHIELPDNIDDAYLSILDLN